MSFHIRKDRPHQHEPIRLISTKNRKRQAKRHFRVTVQLKGLINSWWRKKNPGKTRFTGVETVFELRNF